MATYKCLSSCDNLKIVNECDCLLEYDIRWARRLSTRAQVLALGEGLAIVLPDCGTVLVAVMQDVHIGATALDGIDIVVHAALVAEVGVPFDGPRPPRAVRSGVEDDEVVLGSTVSHLLSVYNDHLFLGLCRLLCSSSGFSSFLLCSSGLCCLLCSSGFSSFLLCSSISSPLLCSSVAACSSRLDGSGELGPLALGCCRAPTVGLAIEHTLNLACELPCLLVGGVGSTELSEFGLVIGLDPALTVVLLLGGSSYGVLQGGGSFGGGALGPGVGCHSSVVSGLSSGVRGGSVEARALALGQRTECPGAEVDRSRGSLGDLASTVGDVFVGLAFCFGGRLDTVLALGRARLATGQGIQGFLAVVDVGFNILAGLGDKLATVFVTLACSSHLVDLLLSLGEVFIQSKEGLPRDNLVLRHVRRRGVDDRERKDEDCATHYFRGVFVVSPM